MSDERLQEEFDEEIALAEEAASGDTGETIMTASITKDYRFTFGGTTYTFEIENLPNSHNPHPGQGDKIATVQFFHLMVNDISPAPATDFEIEECRAFRILAQNFWTVHYEGIRQAFAVTDADGNVKQTLPTQPSIPIPDMVDFPSSLDACAVRCINTLRAFKPAASQARAAATVKPSPCCALAVMKDLNSNQLIGIHGGVSLHYES